MTDEERFQRMTEKQEALDRSFAEFRRKVLEQRLHIDRTSLLIEEQAVRIDKLSARVANIRGIEGQR